MISRTIDVELPRDIQERADRYVSSRDILTRGQIKARNLRIYDSPEKKREIKLSAKVKDKDRLYLEWEEEISHGLEPEKIDFDILYEDGNVLVINKPAGLVVHPAVGNWTGTLVQGLLYHNREMEEEFREEPGRPGIVHRLDKDTSGVMITAKNRASLEFLSSQFRERETEKTYLALIKGAPPASMGSVEGFIVRDRKDRKKFALVKEERGKWSHSDYVVRERFDGYTLLEVRIHTGRTHQIRVHMKSMNRPILGDPLYGRRDNRFPLAPLMLHSYKLGIALNPHGELTYFEAPPPSEFDRILEALRKN